MNVPNYVPEQMMVPENVTQDPYRVRLMFIRQVIFGFTFSVGVLYLLAVFGPRVMPLHTALGLTIAGVLLLDLSRILFRRGAIEANISLALFPILFLPLGQLLAQLHLLGWPVGAPIAGIGCMALYTLLCGRDFSFVGCYLLSLIPSSLIVAGYCLLHDKSGVIVGWALGWNAVALFYIVYDTASLLSRRRAGEPHGGVVDLYRDHFNFLGFVPRLVRHWRKHKIWADLPIDLEFLNAIDPNVPLSRPIISPKVKRR